MDEPILAFTFPRGTALAVGSAARAIAAARSDVRLANGFSHPRTIIGDFTVAEKTLQHAIHELYRGRYFRPSPVVVIHPLEKLEGGLTQVEHRALRELAEGAGARRAYVWEGRELADHELQAQAFFSQLDAAEA